MCKDATTHRDLHPWFDWRHHTHHQDARQQEDCNGIGRGRRFNPDLVGRAASDCNFSDFWENPPYAPDESYRFEQVGRWYRGLG